MSQFVFGSTARISDLPERPVELEEVPRDVWATGDYVAVEILDGPGLPYFVEAPSGRMAMAGAGDTLVGALGRRAATLDTVGDWTAVGEDLVLHPLTAAGVIGKVTSRANFMAPLPEAGYRGHVLRDGRRCAMADFVDAPADGHPEAPVILIIGTSMDSGKTVAACEIVRALKAMRLRVAGAKLTGVGRYRDILAMSDSGADFIADFIDGGYRRRPSTRRTTSGHSESSCPSLRLRDRTSSSLRRAHRRWSRTTAPPRSASSTTGCVAPCCARWTPTPSSA